MTYEIAKNQALIQPIVNIWLETYKKITESKDKKEDKDAASEKLRYEEVQIEFCTIIIEDKVFEQMCVSTKKKIGIFDGVKDLGSLIGKIIIIEHGESNAGAD